MFSEFEIVYKINPSITNEELNSLFENAWDDWSQNKDFLKALKHSLGYICAYQKDFLVGFVNIAWDGDLHAFILDTTVHKEYQRMGIGVKLVQNAIDLSRKKDIEWLHVDFEPHLESFYRKCGFRDTKAGLINLKNLE